MDPIDKFTARIARDAREEQRIDRAVARRCTRQDRFDRITEFVQYVRLARRRHASFANLDCHDRDLKLPRKQVSMLERKECIVYDMSSRDVSINE